MRKLHWYKYGGIYLLFLLIQLSTASGCDFLSFFFSSVKAIEIWLKNTDQNTGA